MYGVGATQYSISGGNPIADVDQTDVGIFVQDDWRVQAQFHLSLGLRYETQTNIHDWPDIAPRLGFAYAPARKETNLVRQLFAADLDVLRPGLREL